MAIINTTPDSFYEPSRSQNIDQALRQAEQMLIDGADVLDIGGMSTRPGATLIDPQTEQKRILPLIKSLAEQFSQAIISVDTVYATTAQAAVDAGAGIINDVSAGKFDAQLLPTIARTLCANAPARLARYYAKKPTLPAWRSANGSAVFGR